MPHFIGGVTNPTPTKPSLFTTNANNDGYLVDCRVFTSAPGAKHTLVDLTAFAGETVSLDGDPDGHNNIWNATNIQRDAPGPID